MVNPASGKMQRFIEARRIVEAISQDCFNRMDAIIAGHKGRHIGQSDGFTNKNDPAVHWVIWVGRSEEEKGVVGRSKLG